MKKDFLRPLAIYGLASTAIKFIPIFLVPIYSSTFSPDVYGAAEIILALSYVVNVFGTLQLESAFSRYFFESDNADYRKELFSTVFWIIIILSGVLICILMLLSKNISAYILDGKFSEAIFWASINIFLLNIYSFFSVVIRYYNRPIFFSIVSICQLLITILGTILLIVHMGVGVKGIFIGQILGFSISIMAMMVVFRGSLVLRINKLLLKNLLEYALPMVPAVFINWVNNYGLRFFLFFFITLEQIGIFSIALKVASLFIVVEQSIRLSWPPYFWKNYKDQVVRQDFKKIAMGVLMIFLFLSVTFTFFGEYAYKKVIDPQYFEGLKVLSILGLYFCVNIIVPIINIGPAVAKKTIINTYVLLFGAIVNLTLISILSGKYGLVGIAWSLLISKLISLLLFWVFHKKYYSFEIRSVTFLIYLFLPLIIILFNSFIELSFLFKALGTLSIGILMFIQLNKIRTSSVA